MIFRKCFEGMKSEIVLYEIKHHDSWMNATMDIHLIENILCHWLSARESFEVP